MVGFAGKLSTFGRAVSAGLILLMSGCAITDRDVLYSNHASNLVAKGHLRTDTAPQDAPFTVAELTRNFERIAFSYEFYFRGGKLINERLEKPLRRWNGEIRYKMSGDGVTDADIAEVARLTDRLSALTGLEFTATDGEHDMLISIATKRGRRQISKQLAADGQEVYRERYDKWRRTPSWICGATMSSKPDDRNTLAYAHIFLGDELDGVLRTSCLHEEIVQALGLSNDHPAARPSIFNDDQEFALLTRHDEILLQALYHPSLRTGMSATEAIPVATQLFAQLADTPLTK